MKITSTVNMLYIMTLRKAVPYTKRNAKSNKM